MARITGIGGVFYRSKDREKTLAFYRDHLGVPADAYGASFPTTDPALKADTYTVWNPFPDDTTYLEPSGRDFMVNFRVDDLDGMLEKVRAGGCQIVGETESHAFGRFAWFLDPDGVKIELWQPNADLPDNAGNGAG